MSIHRSIESSAVKRAARTARAPALQVGLDVRQEQDVGVARGRGELRLEVLEDVEVGLQRVAGLMSRPYSPAQKNVLPPATCSTSSVLVPRVWRTANSSSPKSSPTGPTTRTSSKSDAAREKCTAEPPSSRSRSPNGVLTASKAMDPTTVRVIGGVKQRNLGLRAPPRPGSPPDPLFFFFGGSRISRAFLGDLLREEFKKKKKKKKKKKASLRS